MMGLLLEKMKTNPEKGVNDMNKVMAVSIKKEYLEIVGEI